MDEDEVRRLNRDGWNRRAKEGDVWSQAVDRKTIARARKGDWQVVLTPNIPVPRDWFGEIAGKDLLGLASGGGQQCPIFAAAGARVTSFDASDEQLANDRAVAEREGLELRTLQGYMHDLSSFADASFDLIFHPCSNCYAPQILPVWRECSRVLRPGGALLAGFNNPAHYIFDSAAQDRGELEPRYTLPYSDFDMPETQLRSFIERDHTIEFSHTLEEQIGGQLAAGLMLTAMFEDADSEPARPSAKLFPPFIATRAVKP